MLRKIFPIANVLGMVIMVFACAMLVPLGVAMWFGDAALIAYDEAIVITLLSGGLLWGLTLKHKRELKIRDGFLLVVMIWAILPAFATLPLLFYLPDLSFTDAYFEAMSGLTTTGSTVLVGLDSLPPSINLWRHLLVWLGGMGIIVLVVAILPLLGIGGRQMYKAETPGPMKDSKLTPRIAETAKGLWLVYSFITVVCVVGYYLAGMTWFDAVCHGFSTMGLGGFSTHDASFGHFNSPAIELVAVVFMLAAGVNFASHFLAFRSFSLAPYRRDPEVRPFLLVVLGSCLGLAGYLVYQGVYPDFLTALRYATFNTVSIATTTGYASTDYNLWPVFAPLWMIMLSSFATCSGSTGGGIKMIRAEVLYKQVYRELVKALHPSAIAQVKVAGEVVQNNIVFAVLAFAFIYMCSIAVLTLLMSLSGLDLISAFSAVVASINNMGPGLDKVGPATNYAILTDFQTWVCSFAMILGRLELFTLLVVLTPAFWKK